MAQTFTADWYSQSANAHTAFGQAEANDLALKSSFSGSSAPSDVVAGQLWYHTSKGLRIRNAGNSAWLKALQGDAYNKTWFYRNDTSEGWIIDSSLTDRVIAIKGGSAAFNVSGGTAGGTWTVSGLAAANESAHVHAATAHNHKWYDVLSGEADKDGAGVALSATIGKAYPHMVITADENDSQMNQDLNTSTNGGSNTGAGSAHTHTVSQDAGWRPAAAVGTLQYPDLS